MRTDLYMRVMGLIVALSLAAIALRLWLPSCSQASPCYISTAPYGWVAVKEVAQ